MNNNVISTLIYQHCPKLAPRFVGCFSCNNFPIITKPGQFQIVNTDPFEKEGQHWVLIGSRRTKFEGEITRVFYFDSLNTAVTSSSALPSNDNKQTPTNRRYIEEEVSYACIKHRLKNFYGTSGVAEAVNFAVIRPYDFGVTPQDPETSTCGLYCIYMAHIIYLEIQINYVTEDDILQFAHEHFDNKFVKQLLYL